MDWRSTALQCIELVLPLSGRLQLQARMPTPGTVDFVSLSIGLDIDFCLCVIDRRYHHPSILTLMGLCQTEQLEGLLLIYERVSLGSLYAFLHNKVSTEY